MTVKLKQLAMFNVDRPVHEPEHIPRPKPGLRPWDMKGGYEEYRAMEQAMLDAHASQSRLAAPVVAQHTSAVG